MPTEEFAVAYSGKSKVGKIPAVVPAGLDRYVNDATVVCDTLRDVLLEVDWTELTPSKARFEFWFPFGLPWCVPAVPPLVDRPPVPCYRTIVFIYDKWYHFIDLSRNKPGSCSDHWVAVGVSSIESAHNLANAITTHSPFNAWVRESDPRVIDLEAKIGGTLWNDVELRVHGAWVAGVPCPVGGGWVLQSGAANEDTSFIVEITEEKYDWVLGGNFVWLDPNVWMDVPLEGVWVRYDDPHITRLRLRLVGNDDPQNRFDALLRTTLIWNYHYFANPYQFAIYHPEHIGLGTPSWWHTAVFACAPWVPESLRNPPDELSLALRRAMFVVADGSLAKWLWWRGSVAVGLTELGVDPANTHLRRFPTTPASKETPGIVMSRYDVGLSPLLTSELRALIQNAWISLAPVGGDGEGEVVGKVWDAVVMSEHHSARDARGKLVINKTTYAGKNWFAFVSQPGIEESTRGSLWLLEK